MEAVIPNHWPQSFPRQNSFSPLCRFALLQWRQQSQSFGDAIPRSDRDRIRGSVGHSGSSFVFHILRVFFTNFDLNLTNPTGNFNFTCFNVYAAF
ncbi:hypothetical protein K1719_019952 [Acacia pycnantha]|nr:hypothetical protein K1719_019952 [Acacia pycnantha]